MGAAVIRALAVALVVLGLGESAAFADGDTAPGTLQVASDRAVVAPEKNDDDDGRLIPWDVHWEAGFGMAAGATQIGNKTFAQTGVNTTARLRVGRASLIGGYQFVSTHRTLEGGDLLQGRSHRLTVGLGLEVARFGDDMLSGETLVALGTGRQFISWDQGTLTRRDLFLHAEQSWVINFERNRTGAIRSPGALLISFYAQLIASHTPPFAIAPVSATHEDRGETDIGFLAGFTTRFRR